jgi:hypothetical protein
LLFHRVPRAHSRAYIAQHRFVEPFYRLHHVTVDEVCGAFCKAVASMGLSCLTMGAIERSTLFTARPSYYAANGSTSSFTLRWPSPDDRNR